MQDRKEHLHSALTSFHRRRQITGLMFAIPAVIFLCVFVFYPVLYNVWLSFTNAKRLSSDNLDFVGLKNYIKLFTDKTFAKRFWTEIVWTVTSVLGQIVVGLLFALVISNKHLKRGTVFRTFLLVPYVVPAIVIALVTRWMLSGDYGIISVWLQNMGLLPHRQSLLALPRPALAVVIIVNIWRSYPFPMLIYWAALKGIDSVMYEAAKVDGATSWQIFWKITLPQLKDTTVILVDKDPDKDVCYLYDTEIAKIVLDDLAAKEPNLTTWLNTQIIDVLQEDDTVTGLVVVSEMNIIEVRAKVVIDSTGDAGVCAKAGATYEIRPDKEIQPMTLIGKVAGVDMDRVEKYYEENPPVMDTMMPPAWHDFKSFPGLMHFGLKDELKDVNLPADKEYLRHWLGIFTSTPNPGEMTINCSGAIEANSTIGMETRTAQENTSQKCLYDVAWAMKNFIPGFENSYLTAIAAMLGVRESRRVICDYEVKFQDFLDAKDFPDSIGRGAMPAGFHTAEGETMVVYDLEPGSSMTIPYSCLVVKGKENLLVAGRCASYEIEVANCIRCMPQCMVMGEAVGTAAAIAVKDGVTARNVDIKKLQAKLIEQGGIL